MAYWKLRSQPLKRKPKKCTGLALIHHPDEAPNDEKIVQQVLFKKIDVAHEVLSYPKKRDEYDRNNEKQ